MIKQEDKSWLHRAVGPTYFLHQDKNKLVLKEKAYFGEREVIDLQEPDGCYPDHLTDYLKMIIVKEDDRLWKSKIGKRLANNADSKYEATKRWHKNIKGRKARETKKIREGNRIVEAVFESQTGERVG